MFSILNHISRYLKTQGSKLLWGGTGGTLLMASLFLLAECAAPAPTAQLAFISEFEGQTWIYVVLPQQATRAVQVSSAVRWDPPTWSPDGRKLAFRIRRNFLTQLYVMDATALQAHQISGLLAVSNYAWDPGSQLIAFSATRHDEEDIFVASAETAARENLTMGNQAADRTPVWSHNGQYIAYLSATGVSETSLCREGCLYKAYLMNRDGTQQRRVTTDETPQDVHRAECSLAWSPDDRYLLFDTGCRPTEILNLYWFDLQENEVRKLTSDQTDDRFGSWCADGSIMFRSFRDFGEQLYHMNQDGSAQQRVPWEIEDVNAVVWTPDCQHFVWPAADTHELLIGDRTSQQVLATGIQGCAPQWSVAGDWIAFTTECLGGEASDIGIMDKTGAHVAILTEDILGKNYAPAWQP